LLTACSALALAACGGEAQNVEQRVDPGPVIERNTAEALAVRSDEVARLIAGGDNCGAKAEGARLRDELNAAVARGVVPEVYVDGLTAAVTEIQARIPPCEEVVQVPPPPRDRGRGKDRKKDGDGKGKKDEGDD
jgi:hypothetical protein